MVGIVILFNVCPLNKLEIKAVTYTLNIRLVIQSIKRDDNVIK
jgi:hypothetical protein